MAAKHKSTGFTLLELLIAIAIFSFLAAGCYQLFHSVARTHETTSRLWQDNNALQRALLIMNKDFAQTTARPVRDEYGDRDMAFVANGSGEAILTHGGWRNFLNAPRSDLQRVSYRLEGGQLLRRYWSVLDRDLETPYQEQVLLDGVEKFNLRFLDHKKVWHNAWPPDGGTQAQRMVQIPAAISYTLVHERAGEISQLVTGSTYPRDGSFVGATATTSSDDSSSDNSDDSSSDGSDGDSGESGQEGEGDVVGGEYE